MGRKGNYIASESFYVLKCFISSNDSKLAGSALFPDVGIGHTDVFTV